jgi:hypothetical protein
MLDLKYYNRLEFLKKKRRKDPPPTCILMGWGSMVGWLLVKLNDWQSNENITNLHYVQ